MALAEPEGEKCYDIVKMDPLLSDNFDEPKYPAQVSLWLAAGGQPGAPGYGLEDLTKFLDAEVSFSQSPSAYCAAHIMSIILVDCLFNNRSDCSAPWEVLTDPWEYMARSSWPIFDLVALWIERRHGQRKVVDAELFKLGCLFPSPSCWSSLPITPESNVNGARARNWYLESKGGQGPKRIKVGTHGTRMNKIEQMVGGFLVFFCETVA